MYVYKPKKDEFILAALSAAGGKTHSPVQVQKLFFLLDRNIGGMLGGPFFKFKPYDYGPFDKRLYEEIEELAGDGLVEINPEKTWSSYSLTDKGQKQGEAVFDRLDPEAQAYIKKASDFVRGLSFTQLVSSIYKAYPEMRKNSVFQD